MRKIMNRFFKCWLAVAFVLSLLTPLLSNRRVFAESGKQTITLHKRLFTEESFPSEMHQNTGNILDANHSLLQNSKGLNGVTFLAVDVTDYYYQKLMLNSNNFNQTDKVVESLNHNIFLQQKGKEIGEVITDDEVEIGEVVAKGETARDNTLAEDGILHFELESVNENRHGVYLIVEVNSQTEITQYSQMLLRFPIAKDDGSIFTGPIHLYPKNIYKAPDPIDPEEPEEPDIYKAPDPIDPEEPEEPEEEPTLLKELDEEKNDFDYNKPINYRIETTLPTNIERYNDIYVEDAFDSRLEFVEGSLKVYFGNYELTEQEMADLFEVIHLPSVEGQKTNGFQIHFNIENLAETKDNWVEKPFIFRYQLKIVNTAQPDIEFANDAFLKTSDRDGNETEHDDSEKVITGGKKFVKVDVKDESKVLEGAKFIIFNEDGNYLTVIGNELSWEKDKEDAFRLISNEKGEFEIRGLSYGSYYLEEVQAPDGYNQLEEAVPFTIGKYSYQTPDGLSVVQRVGNLPEDEDTGPWEEEKERRRKRKTKRSTKT